MLHSLFADVVVVVHLGFVVFVAVGGFLARRHPRMLAAHVPALAWALSIVTIGWPCPLTGLENTLRERAGSGGYPGAFIDRYLTGILYPERYAGLMQALVAVSVVGSYAWLGVGARSRRAAGDRGGRGVGDRDQVGRR